jgi:undecaprenyl pyrophosphate phosphatase UppP
MQNLELEYGIYIIGGSIGAVLLFVLLFIQLINYIRKLNQEIKENKNKNKNRLILGVIFLIFTIAIVGSSYLVYSLLINNEQRPNINLYLR